MFSEIAIITDLLELARNLGGRLGIQLLMKKLRSHVVDNLRLKNPNKILLLFEIFFNK